MKVDKAVNTNDAFNDLTKSIKLEDIFSTLVENKILSIKNQGTREPKINKRRLGTVLLSKNLFGTKRLDQDIERGDVKLNSLSDTKTTFKEDGSIKHICSTSPPHNDNKSDSIASAVDLNVSIFDHIELAERFVDENNSEKLSPKNTINDICINLKQLSEERKPEIENTVKSYGYKIEPRSSIENISNNESKLKSNINDNPNVDTISNCTLSVHNENLTDNDSINRLTKSSLNVQDSYSTYCLNSSRQPIRESSFNEYDVERHRILEAKSISAQCSPIFSRQKLKDLKFLNTDNEQYSSNVFQKGDNFIVLHVGQEGEHRINEKSANKKMSTTPACMEYDSIISYNSNISSGGIIASFNQLTSNFPLISTNKPKTYCDTIKLQKIESNSKKQNKNVDLRKANRKRNTNTKENVTEEGNIRKKKRNSKY